MKVSMNWLKKYAPIPMSPKEYESRMIMTGTGVEGVEYLGKDLEKVVVGRVLTVENHPDSDHLHVCTVDAGTGEILQIVCGAPNVAPGILTPVALVGAILPGGHKISKGRLRGVDSFGMLCGADEIGVPQELYPSVGEKGLLIFHEEYPLGMDVRQIFGFDDYQIDFEILANRPDCLSVLGVASETAAAMGTEFTMPDLSVAETGEGNINDFIKVSVEDSALCPRYAARVVRNVRIGPSPMWMRQALHAAGMRSINNIVDITNIVMLETGHPMHAFDLNKVKGGQIIVRKAKPGEMLRTLDGKEHPLKGSELMICDGVGPTGLAGIMGGEESEITEGTHDILFEAAAFDRTCIRLTSRALGIRTESSGRFERGVNPMTVLVGLNRACHLVNELDAGDVVPGMIDLYPEPLTHQPITASVRRIANRAGVDIPGDKMVQILQKLGFDASVNGDVLTATAPDFRQDVEGEADLCEEVLRYAGYDLIPCTPLKGKAAGFRSVHMLQKDEMRRMLTGMGFYETMSFSFIAKKKLEQLNFAPDDERLQPLPILNPLGEDSAFMRTSLLPGVLTCASVNMAHGNSEGRIYETGTVFDNVRRTAENLPTEKGALCLCMWGAKEDFYSVRTCVEALCKQVGCDVKILPSEENYLHPGRRCALAANGTIIAQIGQIHPDAAENYELDVPAYAAQIDLDALYAAARPMGHVQPIARFPAVTRDLALVMQDSQNVGPVMEEIRRVCGKMLEDIQLFDVFRGIQVGLGRKSVAFSLTFRGDHTLSEEEISGLMNRVLQTAKDNFNAEIRS